MIAYPFGLDGFARQYPDLAASLLDRSAVSGRFGEELTRHFGRLLHAKKEDARLFDAVRAMNTILAGEARPFFVAALVSDARNATARRFAHGELRSFWGTTPIINILPCAAADRLLGNDARTVVNTLYHVSADFDLVLKEQRGWLIQSHGDLFEAYTWIVFAWALQAFDIFFLFNDCGILAPAGGYGSPRFGINRDELRLLRAADKRLYTLTYGADYRTREKTLASGKLNFCMECPDVGKFCVCDDRGAERMFAEISTYATRMLAAGLSLDYVPNPWNIDHLVIDTDRIAPRYPDAPLDEPLRVLHAPNHPHFKGTRFIEDAVQKLRGEGIAITLELISGVPNSEVMDAVQRCHVVVDQLIGGSFGYFAIESMAFGKPVICHVRDAIRTRASSELPIIDANPESIYDRLKELHRDRSLLRDIGRQSRRYVEHHHSVQAFAQRLRHLYFETASLPIEVLDRLAQVKLEPRYVDVAEVSRAADERVTALTLRLAISRRLDAIDSNLTGMSERLQKTNDSLAGLERHLGWIGPERLYMLGRLAESVWRSLRPFARAARSTRAVLRRFSLAPIAFVRGFPSTVVDFLLRSAAGLKPLLIFTARALSRWRLSRGRPRSLWGVTPILTLSYLAQCDRLLELRSDSLVYTTYHTASQFDVNLQRLHQAFITRYPERYMAFSWAVLAYVLLRYDIVHLFCDRGVLPLPDGRMGLSPDELETIKKTDKLLFTYTYGADVRTRGRTMAALPEHNFCAVCPAPGKHCICDDAAGAENLNTIARYADAMLAMGDMTLYVPGGRELSFWPVDTSKVAYLGVSQNAVGPIRIAHAPNHPYFKGTRYLSDAVKELQQQGVALELVSVSGVSNEQVLRLFGEADIIADQFAGGGYGYTAFEGMARGKPVLCYVAKPEWLLAHERCPLIQCEPGKLVEVLRQLVGNRERLHAIGLQGRRYIEKYHSLEAVAARLGRLYLETNAFKASARARLENRVKELESSLQLLPEPDPQYCTWRTSVKSAGRVQREPVAAMPQ